MLAQPLFNTVQSLRTSVGNLFKWQCYILIGNFTNYYYILMFGVHCEASNVQLQLNTNVRI